ncbi:MAG TPA: hypothetical protein VK483_14545 [Chitinophagaceae bacterium]|nr:hypothetical protein [Chitinophagaceae bacterium]
MRHFILLLTISALTIHSSFGQSHPDWEESDRKIIAILTSINRENPREVEAAFAINGNIPKQNLGFGWKQSFLALTGGYIHIYACLYYYNDNIVSYTIQPELPYQRDLKEKYLNWYGRDYTLFDTVVYEYRNTKVEKVVMRPFKYHEDEILKPLTEFVNKDEIKLSEKMLEYMSPGSGMEYGWGGGYPPTMFRNRKAFNQLKDSLTMDEARVLLYSINPASRLTAIEFYRKKDPTLLQEPDISCWIERIYEEVPEIFTLNGCLGRLQNCRELVEKYSKIDLK